MLLLTAWTVACEVVGKHRYAFAVIFTWIRFASVHHSLTVFTLEAFRTSAGIVVANAFQTGAIMAGVWPTNVDILFTDCPEKAMLTNALIAIHKVPAIATVQAGRRCTVVDEFLTVFSWSKKDGYYFFEMQFLHPNRLPL